MATDRFTKSPASRKRMSELISRIGKDESQDAGDLLTDEAVEDLPELSKWKRGITPREVSERVAFREEPLVKEVPEGVEYRTEDSAGGAARPLGEIGGYGRVDEEAFSKMLDEAEPFSFEDEKKLVAQQVADPRNYGSWDGGGGYSYTHVTDDPDNPYIMVKKANRSGARRVVPGTKGIGGSDMYGRILAEKQMLDFDPKVAKAFYDNLPEEQRNAIAAAGNVAVSGEDGEKADDAGEIPVDLRRPDTFYAEGDAGEIPVDLRRPPEPAKEESAPKTSEAGEPLPKPAESQKAKFEDRRDQNIEAFAAPAKKQGEAPAPVPEEKYDPIAAMRDKRSPQQLVGEGFPEHVPGETGLDKLDEAVPGSMSEFSEKVFEPHPFEETAKDAIRYGEKKKVPEAVKDEGEEAEELYILSEYVRDNGGEPEDIEAALKLSKENSTDDLLKLLHYLPANVTARAARTGGM